MPPPLRRDPRGRRYRVQRGVSRGIAVLRGADRAADHRSGETAAWLLGHAVPQRAVHAGDEAKRGGDGEGSVFGAGDARESERTEGKGRSEGAARRQARSVRSGNVLFLALSLIV